MHSMNRRNKDGLWEQPGESTEGIINAEEYGLVAVLPIGMSLICSCNWEEGLEVGSRVEKGDPMGYFLFVGRKEVGLWPTVNAGSTGACAP